MAITAAKPLVKFAPKGVDSFYDTVKARVDRYFADKKIARSANNSMRVKAVVMFAIYFVPYIAIVSSLASASIWLYYACWVLMGLGIVGIGTSVMHDSNHGSYSNNKLVNDLFGGVLNILGGYSRNWRIQHNILHHTYTNLDGLDEDIEAGGLLRMTPNAPYKKFHKYQHLYAWFLYMIMNLFWVTVKDFRQILRYDKNGLLKKEKVTKSQAILELSLYKVIYVAYVIVLPLIFSGVAWYHVVFGFIAMQMMAGLGLACIFQPAHVMETSTFPVPGADRKVEDSWAIHQLLNTTNFSPDSKITAWFIGGLNYQIEHHLFPQVCHIHYSRIAPIVEKTAKEYGLPYNVQKTFAQAIWEHGKMLRALGRGNSVSLQ